MRQCFLRCLLDTHAPIKLVHNVETVIGRSKITKIKDQSCSRQQGKLSNDSPYNGVRLCLLSSFIYIFVCNGCDIG